MVKVSANFTRSVLGRVNAIYAATVALFGAAVIGVLTLPAALLNHGLSSGVQCAIEAFRIRFNLLLGRPGSAIPLLEREADTTLRDHEGAARIERLRLPIWDGRLIRVTYTPDASPHTAKTIAFEAGRPLSALGIGTYILLGLHNPPWDVVIADRYLEGLLMSEGLEATTAMVIRRQVNDWVRNDGGPRQSLEA